MNHFPPPKNQALSHVPELNRTRPLGSLILRLMFSAVNRFPAGSPTFKITTRLLPLVTPVALTSLVCICDDPVFSLPPLIAGDNPPGQAPDPITSAPPLLHPTQPDSVG